MASPAAKLALIVGDDAAMRVLAAWSCVGAPLAKVNDAAVIARIAALAEVTDTRAAALLDRVYTAGCLLDGDITELADRILQQRVLADVKGKKAR